MNKVYFVERFLYRKYASTTRRGDEASIKLKNDITIIRSCSKIP